MSGSVLTQTESYIPDPPVEPINQQLEYLSGNQPLQALDAKFVKYTPSNGVKYNKTQNMIEFRIPKVDRGFIDGTQTTLNLVLEPKPVVKSGETTVGGIYATGSFQNAIAQVDVLHNGELLESIQHYGRHYYPYSVLYANLDQVTGSASIQDLMAPYDRNLLGQLPSGKKLSQDVNPGAGAAWTCIKQNITIPLSLSSLFGPGATKAIPSGLMREGLHVRIYLTDIVPELYYSLAGDGVSNLDYDPTSDYEVTRVSLECKQLVYSHEGFAMIERALGRGVHSWNATQFIANNVNMRPDSAKVNVLLPNTNYRDVKSMVFSTYYSLIEGGTLTYASLMPGLHHAQVLVNGDCYWNTRPQGNYQTNLKNQRAEFAMNLVGLQRNAADLLECNSQMAGQTFAYAAQHSQPGFNTYAQNVTTLEPVGGPAEIPDCGAEDVGYSSTNALIGRTGVSPAYVYWGQNCLRSTDKSRRLVGTDLRGRQVVAMMERYNQIPYNTLTQVLFCSLACGVRFDLDPSTGLVRRVI